MYCLHDANYILISNVFLNLIILKKSEMVFLNLLMTSLRDPDCSVSWTMTCVTIQIHVINLIIFLSEKKLLELSIAQ